MTGRLKDLTVNRDGTQNVTVTVTSDFTKTYDALKDKDISVEIKAASKGRSRDANAFCWALCSEIGRALKPPIDKEDVYRMAIKAVGVYTQTQLLAWDVEKVRQRWESHGDGWVFEVMDDDAVIQMMEKTPAFCFSSLLHACTRSKSGDVPAAR